jgi:16S rRNA (cytidine1402-2'-O)-methyltransferase
MGIENPGSKSYGRLFVVATPIGNLEDITLRAMQTLKKVSFIACEDTRQTRKLLNKYSFKKDLISYFQPKEKQKIPMIIDLIKQGKDAALVSDAGTPGLSDPGYPLIKEAVSQGIKVIPIPGVSAVTSALSAAALPTDRFLFLGFFPPKKEAGRKLLFSLKSELSTLIFYLPTRKLPSFLMLVKEILGERQIVVAREMTKIFEEFLRGTPSELIVKIKDRTIKGEATVLIKKSEKKKSKKET